VRRSWLKRLGWMVLVAALLTYGGPLFVFQRFKRRTVRALEIGSLITVTAAGPIEHASDGEGPVVLVLPGSFGGYDQARAIGRSLTPLGFRVLAVSRPGYLRTPISVGRTPGEQADAFAMLLDSLGLERVAVLSASGGGPSALELAANHPDKVWGLVLISSLNAPKAQPPARIPGPAIANTLFGEGFTTWWQLAKLERSGPAALESPIFTEETRQRLRASPELLARFFELAWFRFPPSLRQDGYLNDREQFERFDFDGFERIAAPTLVVHGVGDRNVPIEQGDRAAARIPGAELLRVEGGDHYVSIARDELVWPRVGAFLRAHTPR